MPPKPPEYGSSGPPFEFLSDVGFKYIGEPQSIIIRGFAVGLSNLTFREVFELAVVQSEFFNDSDDSDEEGHYEFSEPFRKEDFKPHYPNYVYKYLSLQDWNKFVSKGSFRLGSLTDFRESEDDAPSADKFEGCSVAFVDVADEKIVVFAISGFDTYIFSTSRDLTEQKYMREKFGPVVLRIKLKPFLKKLSKHFSHSPVVHRVLYRDMKLIHEQVSVFDVSEPPHATIGVGHNFARMTRRVVRNASLYAKPVAFSREREIRIAFSLSEDVPEPFRIVDPELLKHVRRLR
jgi:hypothetical protein